MRELARRRRIGGKTEGWAEIAIAAFGIGLHRMGQMIAAGRNRDVGPQAQFGAGRIGKNVGAGADILAGALEENVSRLNNIGRDIVEARRLEDAHHRAFDGFQRASLG